MSEGTIELLKDLIAIGSVVLLIAILYAAGLRWVRVEEEPDDG